MPDILKQVGPKQYQFLKSQLNTLNDKAVENDDDDDVPNLVGTFEDAGKKWACPVDVINNKQIQSLWIIREKERMYEIADLKNDWS